MHCRHVCIVIQLSRIVPNKVKNVHSKNHRNINSAKSSFISNIPIEKFQLGNRGRRTVEANSNQGKRGPLTRSPASMEIEEICRTSAFVKKSNNDEKDANEFFKKVFDMADKIQEGVDPLTFSVSKKSKEARKKNLASPGNDSNALNDPTQLSKLFKMRSKHKRELEALKRKKNIDEDITERIRPQRG